MAIDTGIKWTDSTSNPWWGCTKVEEAPACVSCYAEDVDKRGTPKDEPTHWGFGAPRRRISEKSRNEPLKWQRDADKFLQAHRRRQRVFTMSMGDLFDKEVDDSWRAEHFNLMWRCDRLEWQICTKRITQLPKMVPEYWTWNEIDRPGETTWPQHVGVLITVVTQKEADRDNPRLLEIKKRFGIPWVGISYEPAQEYVNFAPWVRPPGMGGLDWIIFGGKSGAKWNDGPFDFDWGRKVRDLCATFNTAFFMKQGNAFQPNDSMIPADLMVRQWPNGH